MSFLHQSSAGVQAGFDASRSLTSVICFISVPAIRCTDLPKVTRRDMFLPACESSVKAFKFTPFSFYMATKQNKDQPRTLRERPLRHWEENPSPVPFRCRQSRFMEVFWAALKCSSFIACVFPAERGMTIFVKQRFL